MRTKSSPKPKRKRPSRLAEKLLMIRVKLGLSQGEILSRLGLAEEIERDYISKYERGVLEPPLHVLCSYAELANVYLDVLARDSFDLPEQLPSPRKSAGITHR